MPFETLLNTLFLFNLKEDIMKTPVLGRVYDYVPVLVINPFVVFSID